MAALSWDLDTARLYEIGVRKGVLYPKATDGSYPKGVAWNGLVSVNESPSGADATKLYANDSVYLVLRSVEEYGGSIEAYTYPDEFAECDGSAELTTGVYVGQQTRKAFGLCYRTAIGNDTDYEDYGYKLHLIYGATASPSEQEHSTINSDAEASTMTWDFDTTPVAVTVVEGLKNTSVITIDSTKTNADKLAALETILYGSETAEPRLPLPDDVFTLMNG